MTPASFLDEENPYLVTLAGAGDRPKTPALALTLLKSRAVPMAEWQAQSSAPLHGGKRRTQAPWEFFLGAPSRSTFE